MGGAVLYGDKGYMFHKGSNVAKKIDAWIQKEMRDLQYQGCTVTYKGNIYMKPRGNNTNACHCLSPRECSRPVRTCETGKIQKKIQEDQEEYTIQCEAKVKSSWCRGCQIYLLNPVQDRSPNTS